MENVDLFVNTVINAAEDKKAENIEVLKVSDLTTIADFFVIMTGNSKVQNQAIADAIVEKAGKKGLFSVEGYDLAEWILLDYGSVIVHIFTPEKREFYDLESLWADAEKILKRDEN
ncbi:ribosome-associated protein [Thermotomaculum hydrothermale]|uniref:Ribosomal silencing factor RsfS n=1 Tax=Thermotomaculum hydrothermale TaxID=981385 RepID=A0A7R6PKY2_9BACT|nr:ribosome silencing factor [Thermotomaculum hydrothermale]BBB32032.1 ribosome-associated protein [Thermotomaculum hydrothermale]